VARLEPSQPKLADLVKGEKKKRKIRRMKKAEASFSTPGRFAHTNKNQRPEKGGSPWILQKSSFEVAY